MSETAAVRVGWEELSNLFRSFHRYEILKAVPTDLCTKRDIVDTVSASRSTVHRCLDAFSEYDWVHVDGSQFKRTPAGTNALRQIRSSTSTIGKANRLAPLFSLAYAHSVELTTKMVVPESTYVSDERAPNKAIRKYYEQLSECASKYIDGYVGTLTEQTVTAITGLENIDRVQLVITTDFKMGK
ncbi:hypothetical protein [Haloarcula sebkhae]|uniref:HVO-A0261-like N-terminal domain-containing protein n=1 Tax=Haloarcula sebkhae TaxID=932660 RepID=A0A830EQE2_9EURY|nr:hypothetical protein GCM10009067_41110 [Haloarcula sebkhae]